MVCSGSAIMEGNGWSDKDARDQAGGQEAGEISRAKWLRNATP